MGFSLVFQEANSFNLKQSYSYIALASETFRTNWPTFWVFVSHSAWKWLSSIKCPSWYGCDWQFQNNFPPWKQKVETQFLIHTTFLSFCETVKKQDSGHWVFSIVTVQVYTGASTSLQILSFTWPGFWNITHFKKIWPFCKNSCSQIVLFCNFQCPNSCM